MVTIVIMGAASPSAKAATWLPTQAIIETLQDLKETSDNPAHFDHFSLPQYTLSASNFVLHLDDFDDTDDLDIIKLSQAVVSIESDVSLDTTPTVVVKENTLYPALGVYEVTLGLESSLEIDFENILDEDIGVDSYLGLETLDSEAIVFPAVQIYVFVVNDNTTVEEGIVFYANNFRKNFSERASLTAQTVKERAQARAYEVMTGLCLSENIFLDEEKLAEFVQSDRISAQEFELSVYAATTPMIADDAIGAEIPVVTTSIVIRTHDNRPPIEYIPNPPVNDGGGTGGNNNNNNIDSGLGNSGTNNSSTGGDSSASCSDSGNQARPAWTSSVTRSPVQVSPSAPSEAEDEDDSDEEVDEPQITGGAATGGSGEADTQPAPASNQAASTAETRGDMYPLARNIILALCLTIFVAGVIALYLYLQKRNLERCKSPLLQNS